MRDIIQILPDHIANQIAAGEVIQRPASVVKELVENSIDAGADIIDILIIDSGKTLIQICDNGFGMSDFDARMAFERHATSKLKSADDLFQLNTKGFRGEALASIAAIAHVELKTKMEGRDIGICVEIEGSKIISHEPCTCKKGSIFSVKNLFYNVPARRNFLKSDNIEFKHIEEEFIRIALAHPNIKFSLIHNDNIIYQVDKGNHKKRIVDIFGKSYESRIFPIEIELDIVKIYGFVSKPEFSKKTRGEQYFFVNNRYFKDSFFNHAVQKSYEGLIQSATFPSYFIFFEINPSNIDVNVHPTKTEIKFEYDKEIYKIIKTTVKEGLGKFNFMPSIDFEQETAFDLPWEFKNKTPIEPSIQVDKNYNPFKSTSINKNLSYTSAIQKAGFEKDNYKKEEWIEMYKNDEIPIQFEIEHNIETEVKQFININNYLIFTLNNELYILNINRAKERIIYNEMLNSFIQHPIYSQQLLFPLTVTFNPANVELWRDNIKLLNQLGFEFEINQNNISFSGVPVQLEDNFIDQCIEEINNKLIEDNIDKGEFAHEFILTIASKSSQSKEDWNIEKCRFFINQWRNCSENAFTSKGNRIYKKLNINQINQFFEHVPFS